MNLACKPGYITHFWMWVEPGLSGRIRANLARAVSKSSRRGLYTNIMSSASASRGSLWEEDEIKALIAVWGETGIQEELDGAVRNKVVFKDVAKKLHEMGYRRDWEQCRKKSKETVQGVKDHNGQTGNGKKAC